MAGRARILIVDDEPFNVDLLEQELELLDYATVAAADGQPGAGAAGGRADRPRAPRYHDAEARRLPGAAADQGRPRLRHIPVIMISALSELESVVRCIELGAEDHLPKPFEPVLLKARVGACLEKKRLHDREREHLAEIDRQRRARRGPPARDPAGCGGRRADRLRARGAAAPRGGRGHVRRCRRLHRLLRGAHARGGGRQPATGSPSASRSWPLGTGSRRSRRWATH